MTAMVAGTQFRGQFENRMKSLIEEVKRLGNIILVIDEVHSIAAAGDAEGGMNAANILKPALSRGEIQVIGATEMEELDPENDSSPDYDGRCSRTQIPTRSHRGTLRKGHC